MQTLFGIGLTPDRFQFVPMQDFTKVWTDQMLYEKYSLSENEINFIEKIMAPIESNSSKDAFTAQDAMAAYVNREIQKEM